MELSVHYNNISADCSCVPREMKTFESEKKINVQKVIDVAPLDIKFRGNILTKLSRSLVRRLLVNVRRIDLGDDRERERERGEAERGEAERMRGTRGRGRRSHEDYGLPVTARLIIARRVPIYERTVTDVERRRTNSEGDIYNLRGRRVERNGVELYCGNSAPKAT